MKFSIRLYFLFFLLFILLCVCLETVKVRWQIAQEFENQAYLNAFSEQVQAN